MPRLRWQIASHRRPRLRRAAHARGCRSSSYRPSISSSDSSPTRSILGTYFLSDDFAYLHDIAAAHSPSIILSALAERYFRPMVVFVYYRTTRSPVSIRSPITRRIVLLNVVDASLVFFLGRALSAPPLVAPLGGLLFLVFGGHSEAITWIGGMADPLVTMCVLSAMLLFLGALRDVRPMRWIVAVWVAFAAALLSKESAAILPGILVALAALAAPEGARGRRWRVLAITLAGMVVVAAAYFDRCGPRCSASRSSASKVSARTGT